MSFNYNYTVLVGRLTKDPEFKQITETFCRLGFTLAIGRPGKREVGEQEVDYVPISLVGNLAAVGSQLLKKGCPVLVWGKIHVRTYEKNGEKRWITEIAADNFQILEKIGLRDEECEVAVEVA